MPDPAPNAELLRALGRLVRGLSALFWGLPLALVVCVQTAKTEWLRPFGCVPPVVATGLLLYGLWQVGQFQKQERVWQNALDRAKLLALVNLGLSPFLYWWNKLPFQEFFAAMATLLGFCALIFLSHLNLVLLRLSAMLPDETLRQEARQFTLLNRVLLLGALLLAVSCLILQQFALLPLVAERLFLMLEHGGPWVNGLFVLLPAILLVLLPLAMTMALLWKTKEVILESIFGGRD
jgi:hypothetical protein